MIDLARIARVVIAGVLISSCGGGGSDAPTDPTPVVTAKVLTSITVTIPSPTIQMGQTTTASATGKDQDGGTISTGTIAWISGTPSVATINASTGVITPVGLGQTQIIATAGGKTGTGNVVVIAAAVAGKFRIVFARGAKCNRDDGTGCDLYFTDVDMSNKTVVTPVTTIAATSAAEYFPALSSTGRFVFFNKITLDSKGLILTNDIWAADLTKSGSAALLIANARFPEISSDDKKIYFSRPDKPRGDLYTAQLTINESAGTIQVGTITNLTSTVTSFVKAEDPFPIGTSSQIAFHYQVSETAFSAVGVLDAATNTVQTIAETAGHPAVNSIGTIASSPVTGGGISVATAKTGGWNAATTLSLPSTANLLAAADTAYGTRSLVRWSYLTWVDDTHILASVMGGATVAGETTFTMCRLFLVTMQGGTYELLTSLLGGVYADYCTSAVRVLK